MYTLSPKSAILGKHAPEPECFNDFLVFQAYDSHCNLVLGEVEETVYVVEDDDEDEEVKVGA